MASFRQWRLRAPAVLVVVVFLLPWGAAYLYRPSGETVNHGTLVEPPRPLEAFYMTALDGQDAGLDTLRGQWTLLYIGGTRCGTPCQHSLYKIERVRLTQGDDMSRVQSLYLAPRSMKARSIENTLVKYRGVHAYRIAPEQLAAMAPGFAWHLGGDSGARGRIYVIDPLGNLMMFYPENADPSGMKKDLKRLLKVSQIG